MSRPSNSTSAGPDTGIAAPPAPAFVPVAGPPSRPRDGGPVLPSEKLIPVGLPMTYVGTWAAIGIASLAYLSFAVSNPAAMSGPGSDTRLTAQLRDERSVQPRGEPEAKRSTDAIEVARLPVAVPQPGESGSNVPFAGTQTARPSAAVQTAARRSPSVFPERHVTTMDILSGARGDSEPQPASPPAGDRFAATVPGASNIVTGSIKVPPPPERGPERPAVARVALKPAAPAQPRPSAQKAPAAPDISFGPATVTAAAEEPAALGVLLATGSSVESLRLTWRLLKERHALDFHGLQPRYIIRENPSAPERKYALIAGPVASASEIARVCSILVTEGLECRTRDFAGNAL